MRMISGALVCAMAMAGAASCANRAAALQTAAAPAVGAAALTPAAGLKKRMTRIVVTGAAAADCQATIDDGDIIGRQRKRVAWMVEDDTSGCTAGRNWHIELEFTSDWNNGNDRIVKVKPDDFKIVKIDQAASPTGSDGHDYKVYIVYPAPWPWQTPVRIPLIDPELDIEM